MKVLFVCVANVGRSQMAEAFFNRISAHEATSAGSQVGDKEGQNLRDRAGEPQASSTPGNMLQIMQDEEGLNLYDNLRAQTKSTFTLSPLLNQSQRETYMDSYMNFL